MGGGWGGGVQQSGPDTKHFEVMCPALSCQLVWPGSRYCDLQPWCGRELRPGCLSVGPVSAVLQVCLPGALVPPPRG